VLILGLHLLRGGRVPLIHILDAVFVLHLHFILLRRLCFEALFLAIELRRELFSQLVDFVLVVLVLQIH
jgi:hypothetical protein